MSTIRVCSECGSPISESARDAFCPRCLIGLALDAEDETEVVPPSENNFSTSTGRVFGNYDVLEQIGQGGMGAVYRARQRTLNRVVALKLMLAGSRATEAEIKRFHTEAKAAASSSKGPGKGTGKSWVLSKGQWKHSYSFPTPTQWSSQWPAWRSARWRLPGRPGSRS